MERRLPADTGKYGFLVSTQLAPVAYPIIVEDRLLDICARLGWPANRLLWEATPQTHPADGTLTDLSAVLVIYLDHPSIKPFLQPHPDYKMFYPKEDD